MPGGVTITQNNTEKIFRQILLGTARALNRSMATGKTDAVRQVAANVGVQQKLVRERIVLEKAQVTDLEATLRFTGKRFRVIDLPPSRRPRIPHAFLATMRSGHTGVFVRVPPFHSRKGRGLPRSSPQLPIAERFLVSVPYVATKNGYLQTTLTVATEAFEKNAAHDVSFATSGGV